MFDYNLLTKSPDGPEWHGESPDGIALYLRGTEDGPDAAAIEQARKVVDMLEEVRRKAIGMADSCMKDAGDWHLSEIDVGLQAQRYGCDYLVGLYFDPKNGSDEYGYTKFSVCFRSLADQHAAVHNTPWKLIIEYH